MNHVQLAKALGMSRQMVFRHEKAGRLTQEPSGGFDLGKAKAQLAANVRQRKEAPQERERRAAPPGHVESGGPNLAKAQLAHELAKAKRASILVGQLEGTLVDARKVELAWTEHIKAAANRFLNIPDTIGLRFGEECRDVLRAEIRRALVELSEYRAAA